VRPQIFDQKASGIAIIVLRTSTDQEKSFSLFVAGSFYFFDPILYSKQIDI